MRNFILRSVLPTLATAALFATAMFVLILPSMERAVMDQKREMIRELTTSAWNILAWFDARIKSGELDPGQARAQAIEEIKALHYGRDMKSYFWVNDFHPRMIIHPYRPDLNGKDLTDFTDPTGVKLFVEAVRVVKTAGSGFISYKWQWMDDPARIVPKISYVKGYEPWGWIIGTGVYLDDVRFEMASLQTRLTLTAVSITLAMALLLSYLLWGSYRAEVQKGLALDSLKASEERYRLLVESAGEYIILALGGQGLFANASMLNLLGHTAAEMASLSVSDIIMPGENGRNGGVPYHQRFLRGETVPASYEAHLRCADGSLKRVMVSLSNIAGTGDHPEERQGFLIVASEVTPRQERVLQQDRLLADLQQSLLYMHGTIAQMTLPRAPMVTPETTAARAALALAASGAPAIVVSGTSAIVVSAAPVNGRNDGQESGAESPPITGVLTTARLLGALGSGDPGAPVGTLPLDPAVTIPGSTLLFDAWIALEKNGFSPLLVIDDKKLVTADTKEENGGREDSDPALPGPRLLGPAQFAALGSCAPTNILREIHSAPAAGPMASAAKRVPELSGSLMRNGVKPSLVNRLVSDVSDGATARAVELAIERIGPPPADFCFLVMGSQGRREQTLCSDQDNALIIANTHYPGRSDSDVADWFEALGNMVCQDLAACGYAPCKGDIMASNSRWRQNLSAWNSDFRGWISASEAEDLLQAKIFFDFRAVAGNSALASELEKTLTAALTVNPTFFPLMARNVLLNEPPLGLFGNFVVKDTGWGEEAIDIKGAMSIITDMARIYALRHGVKARGTLERLDRLRNLGILTPQSHADITQAHGFLMKLRLETQLAALGVNRPPDNFVRPETLSTLDQKTLKETFALLKHFQVRVSYDFTGMMAT